MHTYIYSTYRNTTPEGCPAINWCLQMLMYQLGRLSDQVQGSNNDGDMQDGDDFIVKRLYS